MRNPINACKNFSMRRFGSNKHPEYQFAMCVLNNGSIV